MSYEIEYTVFSKKIENHEILLHCTDISTKEIITDYK